jgi:hypothetical protein
MYRALISVVLVALPLAAQADVYRTVDANGHVQYSDTPSPGAQLVTAAEDTAASSGTSDKSASPAQKINQQISDRLAHEAAARETAKDTAEAHEQQCKQAQAAYQNAIQARRLYTMGADGQRQYLSNDQAEQQRVSYREAMEAACKDSDSQ